MRTPESRLPEGHNYITLSLGGQAVRLINMSSDEKGGTSTDSDDFESICQRMNDQLAHDGTHPSPVNLVAWRQTASNRAPELRQISPHLPCHFTADGMAALAINRFMLPGEQWHESYPFDTASGRIECLVEPTGKFSFRCRLLPIPTRVIFKQQQIGVPGIGLVEVAVAFAGEFYLLAGAEPLGIHLETSLTDTRKMEDFGLRLLNAAPLFFNLQHPLTGKPAEAAGIIFTSENNDNLKQAVVYRNATIGRSPGLTACAARMAWEQTNRESPEPMLISSPTGNQVVVAPSNKDDHINADFACFDIEINAIITETGSLNLL